jgi:hypothetical protein
MLSVISTFRVAEPFGHDVDRLPGLEEATSRKCA